MRTGIRDRRRRWLGPVALLALGMFVGAPAEGQELTDQTISDAVEDEFLLDLTIPVSNIDVRTTDGIVTLDGRANSILAKERATRIAETVKGVRAVVNQIKVQPITVRTDSEIQADVKEALLVDPATDSFQIEAKVNNGTVTLTGTTESWQERELAAKVAKGVRGVKELKNNIKVDYQAERPDPEIRQEIKKALRWDVLVDDALIDVTVQDGRVHLTGTVGSAAEKRQATLTAWVAGVEEVEHSGLDVKRWARDPELRKDKYVDVSDAEIRAAVEDALMFDPRTNSFNVRVEVDNRVATLRGEVDNLKAMRAAGQDARNTVGVWRVENRLKVRPTATAADEKLTKKVRDAITRFPYLERHEITIDVNNGIANLYGAVDTYFEKAQADDAASRVNGVIAVNNALDVRSEYRPISYEPYVDDWYVYDYDWYDYQPYYTYRTDTEIKDDIQDELWWSPFVDSDDINVSVEDGMATLTGTVDSWSERQSATENAYEGGATWVNNNLSVQ